jgi:hypothetical protein
MSDAAPIDHALYAWVTRTRDGKVSLVGAYMEHLRAHTSLTAFSRQTMELMGPLAVSHGQQLGQPIYLVQFTDATVLESYPAPDLSS